MNTTIEQLTLPTPLGEEVLDMTEFATNESVVNGIASVKEKVDEESQVIQSAIQNIDLSPIESKVDEVKQAVENIDLSPIESKVEEGVNTLSSKIDNIDLLAVENKVQEESAAIQAKIDNIKLPEIDTSALAKQGENQDATNTAIYALLSQFGESVLQEAVTVICNCAEDIAWEEYGVVITYADGTSQSLPMSENGTCSFSIKIGQEYSVQLPVIGAYIAPTLKTYTASTSSRQIYWSYVVSGVFGLDELGRRYTIAQIEALEDKSIIKYGGFTNSVLENSTRDDGTTGNGFMWRLDVEEISQMTWSNSKIKFSQELLPFVTDVSNAYSYCAGEDYTRYVKSEGLRIDLTTPAATYCNNKTITINNVTMTGFLPAYGQIRILYDNKSSFKALYTACGLTTSSTFMSNFIGGYGKWWTSMQFSAEKAVVLDYGIRYRGFEKTDVGGYTFVFYPLPK
jgi:hypothetical protein